MKKIFAIAMLALSIGAVAQPRKIVPHQSQKEYVYKHHQKDHRKDSRYDKKEFHRLDLSKRQEKQLTELLKDKQRELSRIKGSRMGKMHQIRAIDKKYDQRIYRLLSTSQWRKWNQYYAYQYASHAKYKV